MLAALSFLVGLIVIAIGANFIWTSDEMANDERDVLHTPRRFVLVRSWSHRLGGAFLIVIGLGILVDPIF